MDDCMLFTAGFSLLGQEPEQVCMYAYLLTAAWGSE